MKEQEHSGINLSAPETSPLHEQGGLTPDRWQYIASLKFNDPKINQYAQAKAAGLIDEEQGPFIGSRHWDEVLNVTRGEPDSTPDQFTLVKEIIEFAKEKAKTSTLNDYFDELIRSKGRKGGIHWTGLRWAETIEKTVAWEDPGRNGERLYRYDEQSSGDYTYSYTRGVDRGEVLRRHYLTPSEVGFMVLPSPDRLRKKARQLDPKLLRERIAVYHIRDINRIRGWEKPVPQAAQGR